MLWLIYSSSSGFSYSLYSESNSECPNDFESSPNFDGPGGYIPNWPGSSNSFENGCRALGFRILKSPGFLFPNSGCTGFPKSPGALGRDPNSSGWGKRLPYLPGPIDRPSNTPSWERSVPNCPGSCVPLWKPESGLGPPVVGIIGDSICDCASTPSGAPVFTPIWGQASLAFGCIPYAAPGSPNALLAAGWVCSGGWLGAAGGIPYRFDVIARTWSIRCFMWSRFSCIWSSCCFHCCSYCMYCSLSGWPENESKMRKFKTSYNIVYFAVQAWWLNCSHVWLSGVWMRLSHEKPLEGKGMKIVEATQLALWLWQYYHQTRLLVKSL